MTISFGYEVKIHPSCEQSSLVRFRFSWGGWYGGFVFCCRFRASVWFSESCSSSGFGLSAAELVAR